MMEEEGQVHGILLSIVVSDEVDGLEVRPERLCHRHHVPNELETMLFETFNDLMFLASVRYEVLFNDSTVN